MAANCDDTSPRPKPHGFALFGTGRIGSVHFRNLFASPWRVDVKWIVEEDVARAEALLEKYQLRGRVKVASNKDADQVLKDPSVDAVMVCTPSFTHENIIKAALAEGKAVFCEKPLAPSVEATKACYDVAAEKNLLLFCGFNRRFDPQCRRIFDQIQAGHVGTPRVVKVTSRDPPAMITREYLASSGGIFIDMAIHDIDMVCWLAGENPVSVYVTGHATNPLFVECDDVDSTVVTLRFPRGAIGCIETSRDAHCGHDQRIEVLCTKGMLQSSNKRPTDVWHWTLEGATVDPIYMGVDRYLEGYRLELEHFLDALDGKVNLEVSAASALLVNRIADACKQSLKTGKVVEL